MKIEADLQPSDVQTIVDALEHYEQVNDEYLAQHPKDSLEWTHHNRHDDYVKVKSDSQRLAELFRMFVK